MEPGRKLDALVAERVQGYECICDEEPIDCPIHAYGDRDTLRSYSTDIAAAWTVIEKLAQSGWRLELNAKLLHRKQIRAYSATFDKLMDDGSLVFARGLECKTAPLAICVAALEAVGVEVGDD